MYTFQPLAPVEPSHVGFGFTVAIVLFLWVVLLANAREENLSIFRCSLLLVMLTMFAYFVSYQWTDQRTAYYPNVKVEAQLVGFEAEGYKEKSVKSYVDRHFTYVVYSVNGDHVLMHASTGVTYPKTAILYKN